MGGVRYLLHKDKGVTSAFLTEIITTAVAGKAVVIPDYVTLSGRKYPVTHIRAEAFKGKNITSVKLPSTLKEIRNATFRDTPITEITIPASVDIIQGSAFYGCKKLKTLTIPRSVVKIAESAFANSGIVELDVSSVKEFESGCFSGCTSLKALKFNASLKNDFVSEIYLETGINECPFLQVKYENNQYVIPSGITFVNGK